MVHVVVCCCCCCSYCCCMMARILCVAGLCEDYEMACPAMAYDATTNLTATVNSTNFDTCRFGGFSQVNKMFFRIVYPDNSFANICELPFPDCNSAVTSESSGQRCSCTSSANNNWQYQLEFLFDSTQYKGATLRIVSNCIAGSYVFLYTSCENLEGEWIHNTTLRVPYLLI